VRRCAGDLVRAAPARFALCNLLAHNGEVTVRVLGRFVEVAQVVVVEGFDGHAPGHVVEVVRAQGWFGGGLRSAGWVVGCLD
jgi:hypothetical protein